ncbi:MAG: carotenoid biosynthesis protein [Coleofasciculus chthonoplastes F3-SA18-01]|uniref:gamma-carotene 1'-hydroxylase CruF n=1 Tax=Coleofasciculus chthonoplastes TaxID=64178 RepID=UPI0032FC9C41
MKQLIKTERFLLIGHIGAMAFGLAGLLLVLPHPEWIMSLPPQGQTLFQWSMAGGGVVYIILGAAAVAIYAYRTLGLWQWLTFMIPAIVISLTSELLGTSTGFPFGHYGYLSGLGYKIAGLVPFTIPLSWFYLGLVSYLLARAGLESRVATNQSISWWRHLGAIAIGAVLLTSWDFVLDPAMSQASVPFWLWEQPGAFFGMPYQNFAGWLGTGAVFMAVAALFWQKTPMALSRSQLGLPLAVYLSNFVFAAVMSIGAQIWIPIGLGILLGVVPAVVLWRMATTTPTSNTLEQAQRDRTPEAKVPVASIK